MVVGGLVFFRLYEPLLRELSAVETLIQPVLGMAASTLVVLATILLVDRDLPTQTFGGM